jgi:hypothetical protein
VQRFQLFLIRFGSYVSSDAKGFKFPSGVDDGFGAYFYPSLLPDGSFIVVLPLGDQPPQPPYGYNDHRDVILRINGTNGMQIWNITSGNFNPQNGEYRRKKWHHASQSFETKVILQPFFALLCFLMGTLCFGSAPVENSFLSVLIGTRRLSSSISVGTPR